MVECKHCFHSLRIIDYAVSDVGEASLKIHIDPSLHSC